MNRPSRSVVPRTPCPSIGRLAAYVDGVLNSADREEIQGHLITCVNCRDTVADAARLLNATIHRRSGRWILWTAALVATAASAILAVAYGSRLTVLLDSWTARSHVSELVAAVAREPNRPIEARLSGGFRYAPPLSNIRGKAEQAASPDVRVVALKLIETAAKNPTPENRAAAGVAHLLLGEFDQSIDALEAAAHEQPHPHILNDLSAARLARAGWLDRTEDWVDALEAADQCLRKDPRSPEARFNRALALDGLHRDQAAAEAWISFRSVAESSWQSEADKRERIARVRLRP